MSLVLIHPAPDAAGAGTRLEGVLRSALGGREVRTLRRAEDLNGLSGQKEQTQREIAAKLGISRSYVSRIEKNALKKLRETL